MALEICSNRHREVVYEDGDCPVCEEIEEVKRVQSDYDELKEEYENLKIDYDELKKETDNG